MDAISINIFNIIIFTLRSEWKMSGKIRIPQEGDRENTIKAYGLVMELMDKHSEIERSLWIGAFYSLIASAYKNSGVTYEQLMFEMNEVGDKYKNWVGNDN